jgi:hypothetical protein
MERRVWFKASPGKRLMRLHLYQLKTDVPVITAMQEV